MTEQRNTTGTATANSPDGTAAERSQGELVAARGLRRTFNDSPVLDGVDFSMQAGQITVIIGRSGSGKSTLLRVLAGLTEPEDGDLTIAGHLVRKGGVRTDDYAKGEALVGMVFQSYTLWPHMNVLDNLTLAPRKVLGMSRSEAEDRAATALGEVGMAHHIRSRSTGLSGGERQRVAIARALMMRPRLLLCDEITSALDPPVAAEVLSVLARLKNEEGIAVALVTHDMAFASKAADRLVFFSQGRIAVDATPEQVFRGCENAELRSFVEAVTLS
ncbi:ABC transporter ATP-binding protein [Saccharopolyspora subtropica]|uniref:ABC transporter ATP-binding protein n=1 Tax=Saccharopolyspora thermophila TaxID=89367 RepID=A0A917K2N8_9PSEU|nr:amino acid ABC transporter ATP-binding protein [Saccharopolyspora subtropica]GGI98691.1 ABC transporter ATP-binding protein [Saccharopolyspora subtropica]